MKIATTLAASLLASVATARSRHRETGDPIEQTTLITAFRVDREGNPTVECWQLNNLVASMDITRRDGSKAKAYSTSLSSNQDLEGMDILTFPPSSPIWPPSSDEMRADWYDLQNTFNLFNVQGGLINFNFVAARFGLNDDEDEDETHIFSLENGDDWFYFEDAYLNSDLARKADAPDYPFDIRTISATETEMLRLSYKDRPKHKVLYKGACKFTGLETPGSDMFSRTSRVQSPLTIQVEI